MPARQSLQLRPMADGQNYSDKVEHPRRGWDNSKLKILFKAGK